MQNQISTNPRRDNFYQSILKSSISVAEIARLGSKLMRKEKLHPHFHQGHSLLSNALYLAFFSLELPYEYKNKNYLNRQLTRSEMTKILELYEKRISSRMPVEYITHEAQYLGRKFYVNENVLVPRSLMSGRFQAFLKQVQWQNYRVLDLCSGSGCIGITLAHLDPRIQVDLADISPKALEVAAINIKKHGVSMRVSCIQSDLFDNIRHKYDLIITNPPYVPEGEYPPQPEEVKREPQLALLGGVDGLDIIKRILAESKKYLNPQGKLIAEVGYPGARFLKKQYPWVPFQWYVCNAKWFESDNPHARASWFDVCMSAVFGTHSIFACGAGDLP